MVILWYGLVPLIGALVRRYKWHLFRSRFNELRLCPLLDYRHYWQREKNETGGESSGTAVPAPNTFRFVGGFESVTDGQTLWIQSDDLTVPVSLKNAQTYLLPMQSSDDAAGMFDPDSGAPEKINWERVTALTGGARVFVGGLMAYQNKRLSFVSTKENPLIVIFFDGSDQTLMSLVIKAGRHRGDYWNAITPYSIILGALCLILMAVSFLSRPAFRLTVIVSVIALFVPLYPIIPPGLLLTNIHRRLVWRSRLLRVYADHARLMRSGEPQSHARIFTARAYILETLAWFLLIAGIGLNIFFLSMVIALF